MRLFILGATGGTGRELVDQALERRHHATAFVRAPEKLGAPREGLTVVRGDLRDAEAIGAALAGHSVLAGTRWQIMKLTYRVDGDTIISNQPSAPREEGTRFALAQEGTLTLEFGGVRGLFRRGEKQAPRV